jgi:asparagine synthase (glutamine-hydrolysing)
MSAIAGVCHFNNEPVSYDHSAVVMQDLQKYPADDVQLWHKENIFFGCHSQWITPESIHEQLPYYDQGKQLAITADAIIDNREELFERLQVKQDYQKTMPDSQLILLAYQKWQEDAPKYLIGDFAFIIWDERKQKLFGARDFSGSRTLYYYNRENRFAFCTVIQPLLALPYIKKQLNEGWLAEFLAIPWNFESVDTSSTVYKNIEQLPPSHTITVVEGRIKLTKYSTFDFEKKIQLKSSSEYEEAFLEVYQRAVTSRTRTHRNVGAHLSGGLDSGSVASLAANNLKRNNKKLHTFSYVPVEGFKDWTSKGRIADERPLIRSTVKHVGNIEDNYYNFQEKNPFTEVDDWLKTLEMPYKFFENSFWLSGIYEKAYEKDIGVLLNGQRGNWTVSWGPAMDYQAMLFKKLKWISLNREIDLYSKNLGVPKSRIVRVVRRKALSSLRGVLKSPTNLNNSLFPIMINPEFANRQKVYDRLREHNIDLTGLSIIDSYKVRKLQFEKLYYWNINGTYATKLSLRYKVWDRDPTNDLRIVKFCLSVPEEQYVKDGVDRSLIRRATKGFLPDNVRLNQRTRGIQGTDGIHRMIPNWNLFIEELKELILDPLTSIYLNKSLIQEKIKRFENGPKPEDVFDLDFKLLMKSLIVYRFLNKFT